MTRQLLVRVLVVVTLGLGTNYLAWRWAHSVNWHNWWIAAPLVLAETYTLLDSYLFGLTMWRMKRRSAPPRPPDGATVDVLITTYDEPVALLTATARAAKAITYPHTTWILDDGDRHEIRREADRIGVCYLTRGAEWINRPRHAKAGNLNNALARTQGEFLLVLDADQIPDPVILDHTLGYFRDPEVAMVQTPQWFSNVTGSDPLGSQAPLFYGPIQQGKDGWNAAFFCGSNAVLRREALMRLGIAGYAREIRTAVRHTLRTADRMLLRARRQTTNQASAAVDQVRSAAADAGRRLDRGEPLAQLTYDFQRELDAAARTLVAEHLREIQDDLREIGESPIEPDQETDLPVVDEESLARLASRDWSPLGALESIRRLVTAIDVGREGEAQPVMPMSTLSVTEDMATCLRLHAMGWSSVYHQEILASGLAPESLAAMLRQRLRWAQGTLQVMLRENPLVLRGLSIGQRLMYFATMWSYLSGMAAVVFLTAPVVYLCFGVSPVTAFGGEFLLHFVPYAAANQLLFAVVGYGIKTWRGHQYSLALFPVWITACVTAAANVFLGRPLGFAVTPKTRPAQWSFPVRLVLPQLVATVALVAAAVVGLVRLLTGTATNAVGIGINIAWVAYDLLALSVIYQAALYRAPEPLLEAAT